MEWLVAFTVWLSTTPSLSNDYGKAADHIRRALLEYDHVKHRVRVWENKALDYTGLEKDDLTYVVWTIPLVSGRVSTKPFKNFCYEREDWVLRPEMEYKFQGQESFSGMLIFNLTWE